MKLRLAVVVFFLVAPNTLYSQIIDVLKDRVLSQAAWAMQQDPVTVTSYRSSRSEGGPHDFYSEGDYWWPDPANPEGPYLQRDGQTNPDNFADHRRAMIRLRHIVGALASAYKITGDPRYAQHALRHAKAWFVDAETKMNPSLLYAQAIKGRATGRGIGIVDTIHLMEVAQGMLVIGNAADVDKAVIRKVKDWFAEYVLWLTTHPYGKDEMNAQNNHGTCWVMQVASFSRFTGDHKMLEFCRDRYKNVLLPGQMAVDGSFPRELARTKPYGYSIFNLDAMVMTCHILSDRENDLWNFTLKEGQSIRKGIEFLFPFVKTKDAWPFAKDVMYWDNWPAAQPFLLFGAVAFSNNEWLDTWKNLDHDPQVEEVVRNLPVQNPLIWLKE
ncbi:MAG TPA: alginate lyase family protein [Cyclobacteriaceae bacterium]|nr:alginate lyase family protein [Cyclobacteriaceae bacterium]